MYICGSINEIALTTGKVVFLLRYGSSSTLGQACVTFNNVNKRCKKDQTDKQTGLGIYHRIICTRKQCLRLPHGCHCSAHHVLVKFPIYARQMFCTYGCPPGKSWKNPSKLYRKENVTHHTGEPLVFRLFSTEYFFNIKNQKQL